MSAESIQASINAGLAAMAQAVGQQTSVYRAQDQSAPVAPINLIAEMLAYFDPDPNFDQKHANLYNKPIWYGGFDRTDTLPGDYLVTADTTYFVAAQQNLLPTACVECNAVATFRRPLGKVRNIVTNQIILERWPVSALNGTKGEQPADKLPGETRAGWLAILMPAIPGLEVIQKGDLITLEGNEDDVFEVASNERSSLGWRISGAYAGS